jgi:hypothetical protein
MNRCLKDQALQSLLYEGEGTSAQRTHLKECASCAQRSRQLASDLERICQALREEPPPRAVRHRSRPFHVRWLPVAVAVGLAFVLVWERVRIQSPSVSAPVNEEIWSVVDESSADLIMQSQGGAEDLWMALADTYDRAAALEADRPCEWYDISTSGEVESVDIGSGEDGVLVPVCVEFDRS